MSIKSKAGTATNRIGFGQNNLVIKPVLFLEILFLVVTYSLRAQSVPPQPPTEQTETNPSQTTTPITLSSSQFVGQTGTTIEQFIESAFNNRASLLAARQRLAILQGRRLQVGLRPNPVLDSEYGTPRVLGGDPEIDFSVGVSQTFELGGKRGKRVAVADLEIEQARAEVAALERAAAIEIRQSYTRGVSAARQLDVLERLLAANADLVRATEARLKEGDVAPLDANLVRVENDLLRVQAIEARSELETALLDLRIFAGIGVDQKLVVAPQTERPPRLDLSLAELTELALRTRADSTLR